MKRRGGETNGKSIKQSILDIRNYLGAILLFADPAVLSDGDETQQEA